MKEPMTPTVGRVVHYVPDDNDTFQRTEDGVHAAMIADVLDNHCVNLSVLDANGKTVSRTEVALVQPSEPKPPFAHCHWMPYQIGQAERTQQAEQELANSGKPHSPDTGEDKTDQTELVNTETGAAETETGDSTAPANKVLEDSAGDDTEDHPDPGDPPPAPATSEAGDDTDADAQRLADDGGPAEGSAENENTQDSSA